MTLQLIRLVVGLVITGYGWAVFHGRAGRRPGVAMGGSLTVVAGGWAAEADLCGRASSSA